MLFSPDLFGFLVLVKIRVSAALEEKEKNYSELLIALVHGCVGVCMCVRLQTQLLLEKIARTQ